MINSHKEKLEFEKEIVDSVTCDICKKGLFI